MSKKMRDILFRGKRTDNGVWVEGAFCLKDCDDPFGDMVDRPSIIKYDPPFDGFWFRVDPETVGQFTGLTDKNGKKIFEGDIVRSSDPDYPELQVDCGVGQVEFYAGLWYVSGEIHNSLYDLSTICCKELEVIGNIHDNSELLKEAANV